MRRPSGGAPQRGRRQLHHGLPAGDHGARLSGGAGHGWCVLCAPLPRPPRRHRPQCAPLHMRTAPSRALVRRQQWSTVLYNGVQHSRVWVWSAETQVPPFIVLVLVRTLNVLGVWPTRGRGKQGLFHWLQENAALIRGLRFTDSRTHRDSKQ